MESSAIIFMSLSWTFILGLLSVCVFKLLKNPDDANL